MPLTGCTEVAWGIPGTMENKEVTPAEVKLRLAKARIDYLIRDVAEVRRIVAPAPARQTLQLQRAAIPHMLRAIEKRLLDLREQLVLDERIDQVGPDTP